MLKTFHVTGYAVNRRGHTVGIHFDVRASGCERARQLAAEQARAQGYQHPRLISAVACPMAKRGGPHGALSPAR